MQSILKLWIVAQGMGTTASVLLLTHGHYLIGQVGDSRVYLLRDGLLTQLTKDHSYVQEQVDAGFLTPEQAWAMARLNFCAPE